MPSSDAIGGALYRAAARYLGWWPLRWPVGRGHRGPRHAAAALRVGYYHHRFPILSETFIQREIDALRRAGVDVQVLAHDAGDSQHFDELAQRSMATTTYLPPIAVSGPMPTCLPAIARRHPLRLLNVLLYAVCRRHSRRKLLRDDVSLFKRAVFLAGVLRERNVTHVHSPWASADATVAMMAARLADTHYTLQARAIDLHGPDAAFGLDERLRQADGVVTNTRYNEAHLRRLLAAGAPPLRVIYNGLDLERLPGSRAVREPAGPARLLFVGRMAEQKGLEFLLQACHLLRDRGHHIRCEVIGGRDPTDVNAYLRAKKLRRALHLEDEVALLGSQSFARVVEAYAAADVFVLPAVVARDGRHDVTPNVVLEAMAMRLPVVSTTVGAIPEIVEDGLSGVLVPPGDAEALAAALVRVLADAALRQRLGDAARRRVEEKFDARLNARAYAALFRGEASA